jgi:hypothetical protein
LARRPRGMITAMIRGDGSRRTPTNKMLQSSGV